MKTTITFPYIDKFPGCDGCIYSEKFGENYRCLNKKSYFYDKIVSIFNTCVFHETYDNENEQLKCDFCGATDHKDRIFNICSDCINDL